MKKLASLLTACVLAGTLAGCGGGGSSGGTQSPATPTTTTGVATPASVSIVTAN